MPEKLIHCGRLCTTAISKEDMSTYFSSAMNVATASALENMEDSGIFFAHTKRGIMVRINGECSNMTENGCIHGKNCFLLKALVRKTT